MPIYYRGAGTGTYWNLNDATALGFQPRDPGITPSTTRIIQHVAQGLTLSPYISLTRSHPVALHYALETGTNQPTVHAPAYVYEIEINGPSSGFTLIDPLKEIAAAAVGPFDPVGYQHDGYPTVLLGVVSSLMDLFLAPAYTAIDCRWNRSALRHRKSLHLGSCSIVERCRNSCRWQYSAKLCYTAHRSLLEVGV